jgi:hypothetical protein
LLLLVVAYFHLHNQRNHSFFIMTESYEGRVALITGITGQDGSYLTEFLLEKGYTVSHLTVIVAGLLISSSTTTVSVFYLCSLLSFKLTDCTTLRGYEHYRYRCCKCDIFLYFQPCRYTALSVVRRASIRVALITCTAIVTTPASSFSYIMVICVTPPI